VEPTTQQQYRPFAAMRQMMNRMHSLMGSFPSTSMDDEGSDISIIKIETSVPDNGVFTFRSSINFGDSDDFFSPRPWTTANFWGNDEDNKSFGQMCTCILKRFRGLVNNQMNRLLDIVRQNQARFDQDNYNVVVDWDDEDDEEEEEETQEPESTFQGDRFKEVVDEKTNDKEDKPSVNDLEEEEYLATQGFLQADWGVNVLELQTACKKDFEQYCPDSVPRIFYDEMIPRYPPVDISHTGLAPVKDDAPCWMKCAHDHESELTYECAVSSQRMYSWLQVHGEDVEYMESPQFMMLGALIHFLLILLVILTCIRCVRVFVRVRRKRCAERHRQALLQAQVPVVKAITIQIPPALKKKKLEEEEDIPVIVRGTEVSVESL
jgi:hypothetical protein